MGNPCVYLLAKVAEEVSAVTVHCSYFISKSPSFLKKWKIPLDELTKWVVDKQLCLNQTYTSDLLMNVREK